MLLQLPLLWISLCQDIFQQFLSITVLSLYYKGAKTLSIMALSITALSMMILHNNIQESDLILSITSFSIVPHHDTQNNDRIDTSSIPTLSISALSIKTLSIKTLRIKTLSIVTLRIKTLSMVTLSIMTLCKSTFIIWLKLNSTQHHVIQSCLFTVMLVLSCLYYFMRRCTECHTAFRTGACTIKHLRFVIYGKRKDLE
jgi:hypothetical protein